MENNIIVEIRLFKNSGNLKAFADMILPNPLGDITIRGFRVVQKPGSEPWVAFPQTSFLKNGNVQYVPLLEMSRRLRSQIQELILEEYRKHAEK